jgi:hypothetical protein
VVTADATDRVGGGCQVRLRALQTTPELLSSFLALDDRTVATLARSWGGAHATDALSLLATRASHPGVRGLATKGLARLDQAPHGRRDPSGPVSQRCRATVSPNGLP